MKEEEVVTSSKKKEKESPGSADGEGRQQEDALEVPRGVPLQERAEAEAAQFQAESSFRNNTESDDLYYEAEEEMDTFILDILTKRPALDAAQRKRDQETASMTRDSWNDVIKRRSG